MKNKVIFGLGMVAKQALSEIGRENVKYVMSNSPGRWGKLFLGIETISPEMLLAKEGTTPPPCIDCKQLCG